jgi:DNA-directed RNA polymerase subunit RPC12/RpoP
LSINFSCGACRKKFKAQDEHAGRRSKCPACGSDIEVPFQTAWEAAEPSPPTPPQIKPVRTAITPEGRGLPKSEPEPYRPPGAHVQAGEYARELWPDEPEPGQPPELPADEKRRPLWREPVAVIGAVG